MPGPLGYLNHLCILAVHFWSCQWYWFTWITTNYLQQSGYFHFFQNHSSMVKINECCYCTRDHHNHFSLVLLFLLFFFFFYLHRTASKPNRYKLAHLLLTQLQCSSLFLQWSCKTTQTHSNDSTKENKTSISEAAPIQPGQSDAVRH